MSEQNLARSGDHFQGWNSWRDTIERMLCSIYILSGM